MSNVVQRSFAAGEIAPAFYARTDLAKYAIALRTCRNFLIMREGGAGYRPGFEFLDEVSNSAVVGRLIKFVFNVSDTLMMEFGNQTLRFFQNGAVVSAGTVTAWNSGTAYDIGDLAALAGVNYYCILAHSNHTPPNATYWYAMPGTVLEIPTPYLSADLALLNYVQSADVITFTHRSYQPYELTRFSDTDWQLIPMVLGPSIAAPTGLTLTPAAGSAHFYTYVVTAISSVDGSESLPSAVGAAFSAIPTVGAPNVLSWNAVNNPSIPTPTAPIITQGGTPGVVTYNYRVVAQFPAGPSDVSAIGSTTTGNATLSLTNYNILAWPDQPTATSYDIYRGIAGSTTFGKIGSIAGAPGTLTFNDTGLVGDGTSPPQYTLYYNVYVAIDGGAYGLLARVQDRFGSMPPFTYKDTGAVTPDFTTQPPQAFNDFTGAGNYPGVVGYYQQRLLLGGTTNNPAKSWGSRTGKYHDFNKQFPITDDAPIAFTIASDEVDEIRHYLNLGKLIIGAEGAEWLCDGDANNGAITPSAINDRIGSYNGCNMLKPVKVDNTILYVQALGGRVLELKTNILYGYYTFQGDDLTIMSSHLFKGLSIVDWDYQQMPNYTVWAVRSDGVLLSLTYLPSQQFTAWARHDTVGFVENVCVVAEGQEDRVYVIVRRIINGQTKRYVERLASLDIIDYTNDPMFMDSALEYDGRNAGAGSISMTITGGTTWANGELLTLNASAGFFTSGMVGDAIVVHDPSGAAVTISVQNYVSATQITGFSNITVPPALRNAVELVWDHAVPVVAGLSHLEGQAVSVYADGFVVASPNNSTIPTVLTVSGGQITLDRPYAHIWVGLPFIGDLETLDIDTVSGESLVEAKQIVSRVGLYVESSRGIFAGQQFPATTDPDQLDGLDEFELRSEDDDPISQSPPVKTGYVYANIQGRWKTDGRIVIRQVDPVPVKVLATVPQGLMSGGES